MDFEVLDQFEHALCEYTGAPYCVLTDSCTHAVELCLRYQKPLSVKMPKHTYISMIMVLRKLGINYTFHNKSWDYEYCYEGTTIWDSARAFDRNMYKSGQMQCLSFGYDKRLNIGHGGAILLDNKCDYRALRIMGYDGRDLSIKPWEQQSVWSTGYHYNMRLEDAEKGFSMLEQNKLRPRETQRVTYPDVSKLKFKGT